MSGYSGHDRLSLNSIVCLILLLCSTPGYAATVTASWNAPAANADGSPLTDLAGYKIYYGLTPGNYTGTVDAGNATTCQIENLAEGLTYYFAVTAYDTSGNESTYSEEQSFTLPPPSPPPAPDLAVSDSISPYGDLQIPFGDVSAGSSLQQTVTVTNEGNTSLVMGSIALNNPVADPFSITNDTCSGQNISPSSGCTFMVNFSPSSSGYASDSFDIPSSDPDEDSITISVTGNGTPPPAPEISVTDPIGTAGDLQMPFGNVTEGVISDQTVTVTNSGNEYLIIGNIAQGNPLSAPFSILNDHCSGRSIASSSDCTFEVRFAPSAAGTFNDTFDVPSSDADENPVVLNVSGTGLSSLINNPPSGPELVYPLHGQKGLGNKLGFKWKTSNDPDGDGVMYDLYICEDINFTTACITQYNIASLQTEESVYAGIGASGFSIVLFQFITGIIYGTRRGRKVLLMTGIALTAIIFISCGGGGAGGDSGAILTSSDKLTDDGFVGIIHEVSGLSEGTTYYWKVAANDGNGGQTSSIVHSFDTR